MDRRAFLRSGVVIAAAGVAGCGSGTETDRPASGDPSTESPEPTTESPTDEPAGETPTSTPAEASIEVTEVDYPSELPAGRPYTWEYTLENTGEEDGTFSETLYVQFEFTPNQWAESASVEHSVPAGETKTISREATAFHWTTSFTGRIGEDGPEFESELTPPHMDAGETFSMTTGITATAREISFQQSYSWKSSDGTMYEEEASDEKQWAFLDFRAENTGDEPASAPSEFDISLVVGNSQYDRTAITRDDGRYEGGEIQPDIVREGWVAFEVPDDLSASDVEAVWSSQDAYDSWTAYWQM